MISFLAQFEDRGGGVALPETLFGWVILGVLVLIVIAPWAGALFKSKDDRET